LPATSPGQPPGTLAASRYLHDAPAGIFAACPVAEILPQASAVLRLIRHPAPGGNYPRGSVLAMGNFDGLHLGHAALIGEARDRARARGVPVGVLTFEPHPRCVLSPENCPSSLTTLEEKRELLSAAGVDRLVVLEFTAELSHWSAEEFCGRLEDAFALRRLVVGHDFALGHQRAGDTDFLAGRAVHCRSFEFSGSHHSRFVILSGNDRLLGGDFVADFRKGIRVH